MNYYLIYNTTSGSELGVYPGLNELEALNAMLKDAGCEDEEIADDLRIINIEDIQEDTGS